VIEEENGALLSFDHYEASLIDRGETMQKRFLKRSLMLLGLQSGTTKNMILRIMIWQRPVDPPKEVSHKRKPAWAREAIQDAEKYGALEGSLRESKRPRTDSSYVALLSDIIDAEPSSFEEAVGKQVWKDAIHEEY